MKLAVKTLALALALFVSIAIAAAIAGMPRPENPGAGKMAWLALNMLLEASALAAIANRAMEGGWRLALALSFVVFTLKTFNTQVESYVFLNQLVNIITPELLGKIIVMGIIYAALAGPLAVLIIGAGKPERTAPPVALDMPWTRWAWKLLAISVIYTLIYFSFGFCVFLPLAGPAFQEYYRDLQVPAWMPLLQMARAMGWAAVAVIILRVTRAGYREGVALVACAFLVFTAAQLLNAGGVMPDRIRFSHLAELSSSSLALGWLTVAVIAGGMKVGGETSRS